MSKSEKVVHIKDPAVKSSAVAVNDSGKKANVGGVLPASKVKSTSNVVQIKDPAVESNAAVKDLGKMDRVSRVLQPTSQELLNLIGASIAKDLLSRLDSLDQNVGNITKELAVVKTTLGKIVETATKGKKFDESAKVEFVTIQFSDPTQRSSAYECLTKFGVIYERLLFSCANVQKEGLKILGDGRFGFQEVDYSELLNRDERGEERRQTYLRAQRTRLGYDT